MSDQFLETLKDDLPKAFATDLYAQLQAQESAPIETVPTRKYRFSLTATAAALLTTMVGLILVLGSGAASGYLFSSGSTSIIELQPITADNLDQLQLIGTYGNGNLHDMSLSPDGATLAVATSLGLFLHDATDLAAEPTQIGSEMSIWQISYADDGRLLGVMETDNVRRLFVLPVGADTWIEDFRLPHTVGRIWFHPDGNKIMTLGCAENERPVDCGEDWSLARYSITTGFERNLRVSGHDPQVALSLDWSTAAIAESNPRNTAVQISLVNLDSYQVKTVAELPLTESHETDELGTYTLLPRMIFSADGERLVLSLNGNLLGLTPRYTPDVIYDDAIQVWDVDGLWTQEEIIVIGEDEPTVAALDATYQSSLVLDATGEYLIHPGATGLMIADLRLAEENNGLVTYLPTGNRFAHRYQFSPDGSLLYFATYSGELQVWDWQAGIQTQVLRRYSISDIVELQFTADGRHMLQSGLYSVRPAIWTFDAGIPHSHELLLEAEPEVNLDVMQRGVPIDTAYSSSFTVISPDGRYIAYSPIRSDWGDSLWLLDTETDHARQLLDGFDIYEMAFTTNNDLVAVVTMTGLVYRWTFDQIEPGQPNPITQNIRMDNIRTFGPYSQPSVTFSPDGRIAASYVCDAAPRTNQLRPMCEEGALVLSNLEHGGTITRVEIPLNHVAMGALSFTPDGQRLAFGYCVQASQRAHEGVTDGDFCDEGGLTVFALGDYDLSQRSDGSETLEMIATQTGFAGMPHDIAFSAADIWAVENTLGDVTLWQQADDGSLTSLSAPEALSGPLRFSPDGLRMVTATDAGQVQIWGVSIP